MEALYAYAYFFIYAILGWVCEDLYCGIPQKKFINRGFFYGPYCPIYGVGALLVIYPLLFVQNYPVLVFILGVLITSCLEYVTSWAMEVLFKTRWWDYSKRKFNIHGRVCLLNSTLFGIMSLVVIYFIHPHIQEFVMWIPEPTLYAILSALTVGFGIDCVFTVLALLRRKKVFEKLQTQLEQYRAEFEAESQIRVQEAQEAFQEWMQNRQDRLESLQDGVNSFASETKSHLSKAFPEREISSDLREFIASSKKAIDRRFINPDRLQPCRLTNMVMVCDGNKVLVQDRDGKEWNGLTFPGGHVEVGESFVQSAIREVKEETGLDVSDLKLCGIKQFMVKNYRYIVFLYRTNTYSGQIHDTKEGEIFWVDRNELDTYKLADGFMETLDVLDHDGISELYYNPNYIVEKY